MISQHNRNRTYESNVSIFKLTRAQKVSYSLSVNLLLKDFNRIVREVSHNLKIKNLSNQRSDSTKISKDI